MASLIAARRSRTGFPLLAWLVALVVFVALLGLTLKVLSPIPPRTITMATGPIGSASHEFGAQYREVLERSGIELRLQASAGGSENLAHLRDPRTGVSVAFVENGLADRTQAPDLESLGTVSIEPLWTFFRSQSQEPLRQRLAGKRISVGAVGSGADVLARGLLALNGVDSTVVELLRLTPEQTADALLGAEIDGALLLTSWRSPVARRLLLADGIVLEGHPRADAYVALFPSLVKVLLPMGVVDLARNIPPAPVELLAVETGLVMRRELHPALQYLLLEAASEVHRGRDVFHAAGAYPTPNALGLPLSSRARQYYKSGRPFVYRYLPFWLAGPIEQLWVLVIPLVAFVYPAAGAAFGMYRRMLERRIYLLYGELKVLETMLATASGDAVNDLAASLEQLALRANKLRVPLGYAQRLFILKSHIAQARQDVERRRRAGG